MLLAVSGGVIVGVVALGALYDYVAKRHGKSSGMSASGPFMNVGSQTTYGSPRVLPSDKGPTDPSSG
jgi:hypothetical protein